MKKIITILGARPQFIKAAPVSRALATYNRAGGESTVRLREIIVHTGQHYDDNMSAVFFRELNLPRPVYNLDVGSASHGLQTARILERLEKVLLDEKPDMVMVYGDTNSTLAGALAAAKLEIPLAHVEAGLRSFNRAMPEEINRLLTDRLSAVLFAPTRQAVENLTAEGMKEGVFQVGDTMYDAVCYYERLLSDRTAILERLNLCPKEYFLATVHRAGNTDHPGKFRAIIEALDSLDRTVVLPIHPRTRRKLGELTDLSVSPASTPGLLLIDPVSYLDMLVLEKNARKILTDSGGMQKEAYFLGVPCVTIRDDTEWVETVESGWNVLAGTEKEKIINAALAPAPVLDQPERNLYGDGKASEKIVRRIINYLQER